MMDIAYPLGPKRPRKFDPMVWSLRSVWHHYLPGLGRLYVAGETLPLRLDRDKVSFLSIPQTGPKWLNIGANLQAVLDSDISEDFIWMNDDFFVTQNVSDIPLYYHKTIGDRVNYEGSAEWHLGMRSQRDIAYAWGYPPETPCTDLHVPVILNKTRMKHLLDRIRDEFPAHPIGHFRLLYGLGQECFEYPDRKLSGLASLLDPSWEFVSTSPSAWKAKVGEQIRNRYWRKSPFEVES